MSSDLATVDAALDDDHQDSPDGILERFAEGAMDEIDSWTRDHDRGYARGVIRGMDVGGTAGSLLSTAKDAIYDSNAEEPLSGEEYVAAKDSTDYSSLSGKALARQREDTDDAAGGYLLGAAVGLTAPAIGAAVNNDPAFLTLYGGPAAYGALNTVEREARSYLLE